VSLKKITKNQVGSAETAVSVMFIYTAAQDIVNSTLIFNNFAVH
jgi:hypothetical protein